MSKEIGRKKPLFKSLILSALKKITQVNGSIFRPDVADVFLIQIF